MGGALGLNAEFGRGNITSVAECNIHFDAQAADIVFESGVPLTMVSLDVTNPATGLILQEDTIRAIDRSASPAAALFADVCETYLRAPMFDWGHGCVLYDPLAVLAVADPAVGTYADMSVHVETRGALTLGQTVVVPDSPTNMRVMVDVDGHAAVDEIVRTIATL
jgi:inosine-uridine nucleoside N-ribohydrolase